MNLALFDIGFDILLALLLVVTIFYAVVLNKKLDALRSAKGEMERLSLGFSETILKAERSMSGLKTHVVKAGSGLASQVSKAEEITRELDLMIEHAEKLNNRILKTSQGGRDLLARSAQAKGGVSSPQGGRSDVGPRDPQQASEGQKREKSSLLADKMPPAVVGLLKDLKGMR